MLAQFTIQHKYGENGGRQNFDLICDLILEQKKMKLKNDNIETNHNVINDLTNRKGHFT